MDHNRENALCCAGATQLVDPVVTKKATKVRLEEACRTGADILESLCSGCRMTILNRTTISLRSCILAHYLGARWALTTKTNIKNICSPVQRKRSCRMLKNTSNKVLVITKPSARLKNNIRKLTSI
ncbi:MAG TPA: hypothetical protein GXX59_01310 [Syntrophomonadaceae bacterium]|nr:hypothetical protein [Syntrophomonadaceae bacterium]